MRTALRAARVAWLYLALAAVLSSGVLSGGIESAWAQMGDALGRPLPVEGLDVGTVTVRVVDGAPSKPLVGIDVQLLTPDGDARTARTDAQGRATFVKLAAGSRHYARVLTEDGEDMKTTQSEPFDIPSQGGLRLMLSVSPWQAGAAGPAAGAGGPMMRGGMPNPREMSGMARPESNDDPRSLTIRVVRGQMSNNVPDHPVHLVAFASDGSVTRMTQRTDAGGRVQFKDLDTRKVAYYAMSVLPRQLGERTVGDRLRSSIIMMPPQVGLRLLLAGELPDGGAAPAEDLSDVETQRALGPGELVVNLYGQTGNVQSVELVEVTEGEPVSVAKTRVSGASPSNVRGMITPAQPQSSLQAGTLGVTAMRVRANGSEPVAQVEIRLERVSAPAGDAAGDGAAAEVPTRRLVTGAEGIAVFTGLTADAQYRLSATMLGTEVGGDVFTMTDGSGMSASLNMAWESSAEGQAHFRNLPYKPDAVYFARTQVAGKTFTSAPFQMVADRGATMRMLVIESLSDKVGFSFHAQGVIDDVYMAFQSQMTIHNYSYAPWDPGEDGLKIPLPAGFVGAQVEESMMQSVALDKDNGFIWRGAVPPGGAEFTGFFSLPINKGAVSFDWPLPLGALNSLLLLQKTPGVVVDEPSGGQSRDWVDPGGRTYHVVPRISIQPQQRMVLSMRGLPQRPAWERYVTVGVGFLVLGLLGWGFGGVYWARRQQRAVAGADDSSSRLRQKIDTRRKKLLDDLAALELARGELDDKEYDQRKAKLTRQLESVYRELDDASADTAAAR